MKKPTCFVSVGAVGLSVVAGFLANGTLTTHCFAQPVIEPPPPAKTAPFKGMEKGGDKGVEKGMEKEFFKQKQEVGRYQLTLAPDKLYLLDTTNGRCWVRETKPANINQGPESWTEISPPWATAGMPTPGVKIPVVK